LPSVDLSQAILRRRAAPSKIFDSMLRCVARDHLRQALDSRLAAPIPAGLGDPMIELYQGSVFSLRQKLPCVAVMRNKTIAPGPILAFVLDFPDADLA
jgi:hypothetical protein